MSDASRYMELPSLVRQALERSAGALGNEAITREKPVPCVMVAKDDWAIIRDHIVATQKALDEALRERNYYARNDAFID